MKRAAPSQHATAAGCRGGVHGCLPVIGILLLLCCGCVAKQPLRSLKLEREEEDSNDVTLTASNVCLKKLVTEEQIVYYPLNTSKCFEDPSLGLSYLEVQARIYQQCADNHTWSVFVNTQGENVPVTNVTSTSGDHNTFVDFMGGETYGVNGHLDIPLGQNASQLWTVGFYSSCGPVQYSLKSWCSVSKGCNLSCSDPDGGPCVSLDKCRCDLETGEGCDIAVENLPDEEDIVSRYGFSHNRDTVSHGAWKYFRFQAYKNESRSLVEMDRAYGDLVLFVKRDDSFETNDDDNIDALPIEQDVKFADLLSFQNRLSHHALFVNGSGNYIIGVYNTDKCLEEDSTFNLTITTVTPTDAINLCPRNCSYPQGECVRDDVCSCAAGFGGQYCEGSLSRATPRKPYSGQLQPGEWAYINMSAQQLPDDIDVAVSFTSSTGHPILLAQQNDFPTLTKFLLKFSNATLGPTPNDTYRISGASVILGVFNVDYMHRDVSDFELVIIGTPKQLAIWVIILTAIACSVFLLSMALVVRHILQRRGQHGTSRSRMNMDFEATPQELELVQNRHPYTLMISTLPLLAFQKGLLPKEDTGCSICLNSYNVGEIVCRLPVCKHVFHVRCLEAWFRNDGSCPLCRVPLQDQREMTSPDPPGHPTSSLLPSSSSHSIS